MIRRYFFKRKMNKLIFIQQLGISKIKLHEGSYSNKSYISSTTSGCINVHLWRKEGHCITERSFSWTPATCINLFPIPWTSFVDTLLHHQTFVPTFPLSRVILNIQTDLPAEQCPVPVGQLLKPQIITLVVELKSFNKRSEMVDVNTSCQTFCKETRRQQEASRKQESAQW